MHVNLDITLSTQHDGDPDRDKTRSPRGDGGDSGDGHAPRTRAGRRADGAHAHRRGDNGGTRPREPARQVDPSRGTQILTKAVYTHPVTILLVAVLGALLNRILGFKASPILRITALAPLIGPALLALPILAATEYLQRWPFLARMRSAVGAVDLVQMESYYPASAWVFEHRGEIAGVITLDTRRPGLEVDTLLGGSEGEITQRPVDFEVVEKAGFAEIRHLAVDAQLRRYGIASELVAAALDAAFGGTGDTAISRVVVLTSPFSAGGEGVWAKCGFVPVSPEAGWRRDPGIGMLARKGRWMAVERGQWAVARRRVME